MADTNGRPRLVHRHREDRVRLTDALLVEGPLGPGEIPFLFLLP